MEEPSAIKDLRKLCIHTQTNKPWDLETCIRQYHRMGIPGISVWRHTLVNRKLAEVRSMLGDHGLKVVSLVRGGFFASVKETLRSRAIGDNMRAIEQAAEIGAPMVVLVCGSDPAQTLEHSRDQIREGIHAVLSDAESAGIRLAIEPLHPMYAADRSAITTLKQANDLAREFGTGLVGVAVDLYHLWWDESLEQEIARCGEEGKLFAFHVCDWNTPLQDPLNDRGLMGEGCIPVRKIRGWMEKAGFNGFTEVEIFSERYWGMDQERYLEKIVDAYLKNT